MMSPTAFKQHVSQLVSQLLRCSELCTLILETRRVGSKHEALDRLQSGIKAAASSITIEFNSHRKVFGSRMDLGDDLSRHCVKVATRSIESDIENKLSDIANRRNDGLPGFREMLRHIQILEQNVCDAFELFAQRLEKGQFAPTPVSKSQPKPEPIPETKKPKKSDDVLIQLKELAKYTDHMKNSWMETRVAGKILYVNCWDEKKNTWERPSSGFIQALPITMSEDFRVPAMGGSKSGRPHSYYSRDDRWNKHSGW
jgi:hypothetical protein